MSVKLTNEMISGAKETEKKYGVPASITLGQIILESSGDYSGGLSLLGYKYNNLFGVTAGTSWTGKTVVLSNSAGKDTQKYRVYNSISDSIEDHGKLLASSRYTEKTSSATNYEEYAKGIHSAGYATDPDYSSKLINIIKTNNLDQYDSGNYQTVSTGGDSNDDDGFIVSLAKNIVKGVFIILFAILGILFLLGSFGGGEE